MQNTKDLIIMMIVAVFFVGTHAFTEAVQTYTYKVINTYPHDSKAFTQGLVFEHGSLYEGTGLYGDSSLRKIHLETGEIEQIYRLPKKFFGEGITIYKNSIIQLTWQSRIGFVYDIQSFGLMQKFRYSTEGWGITHDGKRLIMSDGTATLYFLDPETYTQRGTLRVRDANSPVRMLNELEYIRGEIYANVWQKNRIARISSDTGTVMGWIDLEELCQWNGVLNGIAYDHEHDRLFVTGKLWPYIYEIKLVEKRR